VPIKQGLISLVVVFSAISFARAQGIMPPLEAPAVESSTAPVTTLLIGQKVPENTLVQDSAGKSRTLLSYKAPLEVLVVYVFSGDCEAEKTVIPRANRLYAKFKDWRVAFVELRNGRPAAPGQWSFPKVTDPSGRVHRQLGIRGTPTVLILDEVGTLRYRGPFGEGADHVAVAQKALEETIGHVEPVAQPEPADVPLCPSR